MAEGFGPAEPDERPLVGARFPHQRRVRAERPPPAGPPPFRVVRRGYAPEDVDAALAGAGAELDRLRAALGQVRDERDEARRHAERLGEELARLRRDRSGTGGEPLPEGAADHGPVADRLLRVARHEALRLRASARQEAADIVDRARREADLARTAAERPPRPGPSAYFEPAPVLTDLDPTPPAPAHPVPTTGASAPDGA